MKQLLAVFALFTLAACLPAGEPGHMHGESHFAPHYKESLFRVSDNNLYSVELLVKGGPMTVGLNEADIILHRNAARNPDVEKATVSVTPWMPAHNHGSNLQPTVIERGAGLYTVENIDLIMEGKWDLRVEVDGPDGRDRTVFTFDDVRKQQAIGHGGEHGHAAIDAKAAGPPPAATSGATVQSVRGRYTVSYASDPSEPPLNRIHSWLLTVTDAGGRPATGLAIKVDGDMPAHGHGLPTRPQITGETGPGVYRLEGLKFSMPGWWTITLYIRDGAETDSATFNLILR
ncbi:MAG: FixH family protein [Thermodesulfobacteriota bacterium]